MVEVRLNPKTNQTNNKRLAKASLAFSSKANNFYGEFDPGSERTLAACFIHASRARKFLLAGASKAANGCVTRE